jgi:hypothetical protein
MAKSARQLDARGPSLCGSASSRRSVRAVERPPVLCLPTRGRGGKGHERGGRSPRGDPAVRDVGTDVGFSPSPEIFRASDLAVGELPDDPGWVHGAPPLAVEYADTGQDEADLRSKNAGAFAAGTRFIWVVRLTGPRRVEVHQPNEKMRIANPGDQLVAPGILANPVPVEALYDRAAGDRVIFRNLLERQGYTSLDEVRAEVEAHGHAEGEALGRAEGEAQGLRRALSRFWKAAACRSTMS